MWGVRKRGFKDDSKIFGQNYSKDEVTDYEAGGDEEIYRDISIYIDISIYVYSCAREK